MTRAHDLLRLLSDGSFHSGVELGSALGISRASICHSVRALTEQGIDVYSVFGKGYRLPEPIELLDEHAIRAWLSPEVNQALPHIDIHFELPSTNQWTMQNAPRAESGGWVCFAERQTAGRGRRGRTWVSPFGGNLYFSMLWRFASVATVAQGLSPAIGLAVAEALNAAAVPDVGVKWPNDVIWNGRKLGGVLLEMAGESAGPCDVVVGVGVNVALPHEVAVAIDQPWVDIRSITGMPVARNHLAATLLEHIVTTLVEFERDGFVQFKDRWRARDAWAGRAAQLLLPTESLHGTVEGVDANGALLFARDGQTRAFTTGELSLRGVVD